MSREVRRRVWLAFAIPMGAALFVALMLWAFSRVLLAVDKDIAPVVALLFALNILVGCTLAAMLRARRSVVLVLGTMIAIVVGAGIAAAFVGEQPVERHAVGAAHGEEVPHGAGASPTPPTEATPTTDASPTAEPTPTEEAPGSGADGVSIAADNLAFNKETLELPTGEATIAFENQDEGIPHNVSIYTDEGGDPLFQGEIITGPAQVDYEVSGLQPGEYYFQCDVHPQMNGTAVVG